jgi:tryptophanase
MPRRVYTEAHAGYVVESLIELYNNPQGVSGYEFTFEAPVMRHFRSKFKPIQGLK